MKIRRIGLILAALLLAFVAVLFAAGQKNDQAELQLKAAMNKELVDGDLKGAIDLYQKVIASYGNNRAVVAQALVQLGQCYEKLGMTEARRAYERVVREFAEQTEPARLARQRLAAIAPPSVRSEVVTRLVWNETNVDFSGSPSADGRLLSFADWNTGDLALRDFTSGQSQSLTRKEGGWNSSSDYAGYSIISPGGGQVAYAWYTWDKSGALTLQLRTIGIDGSGSRLLYSSPEAIYMKPLDWAPDGKHILAGLGKKDKSSEVALISLAGGAVRVIQSYRDGRWFDEEQDSKLTRARFSPDGRYYAHDRQRDIFLVDAETGHEAPVVLHPADDCLLGWAQDGRSLLFLSDRAKTSDVWMIDLAGGKPAGEPRLVRKALGNVIPLGFSRAGSLFYGIGASTYEVYLAELDPATGKRAKAPERASSRFVDSSHWADWSPDGKFLAYLAGKSKPSTIMVRSMESGKEQEIPVNLNLWYCLRWHPDGKSIVVRGIRGKEEGLFRVDVATGAANFLVPSKYSGLGGADFSPDGGSLFYASDDPGEKGRVLRVRDLKTGAEKRLLQGGMFDFVLSPDGRRILYKQRRAAQGLMIMPAEGGQAMELFKGNETDRITAFAWTPDSRRVIFANSIGRVQATGGNFGLYQVSAEGGEPQPLDLTTDGAVRCLRAHPDGRRLAYAVFKFRSEVWTMDNFLPQQEPGKPEMTVQRVMSVGPDEYGSYSPSGNYLCFTDWETGDLAIRELSSGNKRRLTNKGAWSESSEFTISSVPSPDGRWIAYDWMTENGLFELRLVGLDGSQPRILSDRKDSGYIFPCDWSPDGNHILVVILNVDSNQIMLISAKDGTGRLVKSLPKAIFPIERARFSPDGRYIAYDYRSQGNTAQRDIFLVAADGKRESALVQHAADDFLLDWTSDGRHVFFSSDRTGTTDAWLVTVADGKPQGSPELVRKDMGKIAPLGFARDGSYYYAHVIGGNDVYLASVDTATGKVLRPPTLVPQSFLGSNVTPEWSPDGTRLLYLSRRGGMGPAFNIPTIRSMETGEERKLSTGLNFLNQIRWSPDGRSILGVCMDRKERSGICRIDAQTGETTLLVEGFGRIVPNGSPDGKHILYSYTDPNSKLQSIRLHNLETGEVRDVVQGVHYRYSLSSDGRLLAFQTADPSTKEQVLKVVPLAGGEPRELFRIKKSGLSLSWTADSRRVLVGEADEAAEELWLVPVDGGKPSKFTLGIKGVNAPRLHPDGRRIAFWKGNPDAKAEIWVMENFLPSQKTGRR